MKIIDFRVRVPFRDTDKSEEIDLPPRMKRYDEIYGQEVREKLLYKNALKLLT